MTTPRSYEPSSLPERPEAGVTATPSSDALQRATASGVRLGSLLADKDLENWTPTGEDESVETIRSVARYCKTYCPIRLECAGDACRLYRLEGRAAENLGLAPPGPAEEVGVVGQPITAL